MNDNIPDSAPVQLSFDDIEHWRDIPGYEGVYAVSDRGRVMRLKPGNNTFAGRIMKQVLHKGYSHVLLRRGRKKINLAIHRIVMSVFVGPCPQDLQVNHKNGIKTDNRVSNLEYMTLTENMRHSHNVLGRNMARGEQRPNARLSNEQVQEIKRLLANGALSQYKIGKLFNVDHRLIWRIATGKTWRHIS